MSRCRKSGGRRYRKLAAALAGAAFLSTALLPAAPVYLHVPGPAPKPLPAPAQEAPPPAALPAGPEADAKAVMDVTATAYAPGPQDNEQYGDKTHMGTEVRPGVIAVDPRVIPLGSRVMIRYADGTTEYAVAEDTGGAIKGRRIDVAKRTPAEAKEFGIKRVRVYVLNDRR